MHNTSDLPAGAMLMDQMFTSLERILHLYVGFIPTDSSSKELSLKFQGDLTLPSLSHGIRCSADRYCETKKVSSSRTSFSS